MSTLLHITTPRAWRTAERTGFYRADSLKTEGFIHCSLPHQIDGVYQRYYAGETDLLLLLIDDKKVEPEIRYEGHPERFPHIYGPLNIDAVFQVTEM